MSVTLHTTAGDIKIEVFCESVPQTAENFLAHCAQGYYNASKIHRLIPGFMFQTGQPSPTNPIFSSRSLEYVKNGESIWGEPFENEIRPTLRHNARGIVSMANKGPKTNGSQFFITFAPAPHLDGNSTVFGHVLEGEDVLAKLEAVEVDKKGKPKEEVRIERVTIHANPLADS